MAVVGGLCQVRMCLTCFEIIVDTAILLQGWIVVEDAVGVSAGNAC